MRQIKAATIITLLTISVGVLGSHITDSLWPWIPVSVSISVFVVLGCVLSQSNRGLSAEPILGLVIGIAVFYRAYTFVFPASMIGMDPDRYAVGINQLVAAGSIKSMDVGFYQNAPLFPLINGIFAIISGIPVRESMVVIPITTGVVIPLSVYVLTRYITKPQIVRAGLVASLIVVVTTQTVKLSYWPIPQTLATLFLCLFLIVSVRYIDPPYDRQRFFVLFLLLLLSLSLTHKLPVLVVALFFGAFAALIFLLQMIPRQLEIYDPRRPGLWMLFGITFMMLFIQWTYIADFFDTVMLKLIAVFVGGSVTISPALMNPTAAINPYPEIIGILLRTMHAFVLLAVGAIAWLILAYTKWSDRSVQILLIATAILFLLFPFTILVPSEFIYTRVVLFIEPFLAALVAAAFIGQLDQSRNVLNGVLPVTSVGIIVFVIVAQVVAVGAAPDFPGAPRMYLTSEEIAAKEFGYQYLNHSATGPYYANEEAFPDRAVTATGELDQRRTETYSSLTAAFYNATLISGCYPNVLYRQVNVYRFQGWWSLTWNPLPSLDRHYNRIYANGGANHYSRSQCRSTNTTTGA